MLPSTSTTRQSHTVGSTENRSPGRRRFSASGWAAPAGRHHLRDGLRRPRKQRLDAAVPAVAHPAFKIVISGPVLDPGAVADALHASGNRQLTDRAAHLFSEPQEFVATRFRFRFTRNTADQLA